MIRVLLILSSAGLCRRILHQLAAEADLEVRHHAPQMWSAALEDFLPSVVVLDRAELATDGIVAQIARIGRPPSVVLVTDTYHAEDVVPAAKAGVRGYVVDSAVGGLWATIVRTVAAGGGWLAPVAVGVLLDELRNRAPGWPPDRTRIPLTDRELGVLRLLSQGCSNQEIAQELGLSKSTVKTHVSRMLARLDLRSRTQLAAFAHDLGIV